MLKFSKTDRTLELEGTWLDFPDNCGNILKVKVARSDGNPHYESTLTRLSKPHQKNLSKGKTIPPEESKRIMTEVAARELLLDWDSESLLDDEGKPVKYSVDNAIELLTSDNDLRDFVLTESGEQSNFLTKKK